MSEAEYHTLTERCLRPSTWTPFSHADDLFSHAHRMLIRENLADESRGKRNTGEDRRPSSSTPVVARGTGSSKVGDDSGTKTRKNKTKRTAKDSSGVPRSAVFRDPPPLLPMSPAIADGTPSKPGRPAASTRARRISPPPLLPMPSTLFTTSPVDPPSPSLSPPTQRTLPSTPPLYQRTPPLATPPSTPPAKVPTPPRTATPQPGCSSCHMRDETEEEHQLKKKACGVCGDLARSLHFGGLACDSCKAFFRRAVLSNTFMDFTCRKDHHCTITVGSRRSCQACRFAGCLRAGMKVSLAKREDETTARVSLQSLDQHRRLDRPSSNRTHERLHTQNFIYGKNAHTGSAFPAHLAGGTSLAPGLCSLVPDPYSLAPGLCNLVPDPYSLALGPSSFAPGPSSLAPGLDPVSSITEPFHGSAQDFDTVLRQARFSHARGAASCAATSSRSSYMTRSPLASQPSTSGYGATKRYSPISSQTTMIVHSLPTSSHTPMTIDSLSSSHTSVAIHRPSSSHTPTKSHSPTRNHNPVTSLNPNNHTHRSSPNFPLLQTSKRSLSPSTSSRSPSTSSRSPSTRSPLAPWLGVQPDPPAEEHLSIPSGSTSTHGWSRVSSPGNPQMSCPKSDRELDSYLEHHDHTEIKELQKSYSSTFDVKSLPVGERMIRSEELSKLYTCFIQRRARFLVSTPLYRSLAQSDRLKLLHVAVAMSTYFTGAHLIDTKDYTWKNRNSTDEKTFPVMSASTIRQFLSHEQFVYVMRFYTTYSPVFSDQTVTILMQVLSLFYPEPGLADPEAAEQGRLHYISLLSRYLRATYGPQAGSERLRTLIGSQQEARQLVDLLQHVELTPQVPRQDVVDSQRILMEGIQLVCNNARESLVKGVREKQEGFKSDGSGAVSHTRGPQTAAIPVNTPSMQDAERLDFIEKTFNRLANCEDPYILAEARRILPADLIRRFFQQLQCSSASGT